MSEHLQEECVVLCATGSEEGNAAQTWAEGQDYGRKKLFVALFHHDVMLEPLSCRWTVILSKPLATECCRAILTHRVFAPDQVNTVRESIADISSIKKQNKKNKKRFSSQICWLFFLKNKDKHLK